jgi:hypothetical protein
VKLHNLFGCDGSINTLAVNRIEVHPEKGYVVRVGGGWEPGDRS